MKSGSRLLLVMVVGGVGVVGTTTRTAQAQSTDFATCPAVLPACSTSTQNCCTKDFPTSGGNNAIIIPLDRCHQQYANSGVNGPPGATHPDDSGNGWCADPSGNNANGMNYAYGLVYRLMQSKIPVYWIVNPTKQASSVAEFHSASNQVYTAKDVDFWVMSSGANPPNPTVDLTPCTSPCTPPVQKLNSSTLAPIAGSYTKQEFPLRGGAFLIAPADVANFKAFMRHQAPYPALGSRSCGQASNDCYNFSDVVLYQIDTNAHVSWQDMTAFVSPAYTRHDGQLPVAALINYDAPRIARLGLSSAVATGWLKSANLDDPASNASCKSGAFVPSDAVYCNLSETDIQGNQLVDGRFTWAWLDKATLSSCGSTLDKVRTFMTAIPGSWTAGNVMFNESAIASAESCPNKQILGAEGTVGLAANNSAINETASNPFIIRYPQNLFVQWGDIPIGFVSGSVTHWTSYGGTATGYASGFTGASSTLRRLVTQEHTSVASNKVCGDINGNGSIGAGEIPHDPTGTASCDYYPATLNSNADQIDLGVYGRYQNNGNNGIAYYTPGNQINTSPGELRMVLNSLIATPIATVNQTPTSTLEVSRSTPIVALIDGGAAVVQGTYEVPSPAPTVTAFNVAADGASFAFPYTKGHLRAYSTGAFSTTSTAYNATTALFDAADNIPPAVYAGCSHFAGTCRTIFTTTEVSGTGTTRNPALVFLDSSTADTVGPLMASNLTTTEWAILVQRVLAGSPDGSGGYTAELGGVDRSTVAVIPTSTVAGTTRPTMIYFGAADGMFHAVCGSVMGPCDVLGRELWAYIPRTMLPNLRYNTARLQGSPRVVDAFGDFYGTGAKRFRTLLTFQTGTGDATSAGSTPATYALDITDPTNPKVLWEYTMEDVNARGAYELGAGLTLAMGQVRIGSVLRHVTFAQTNNGGVGGAGSVVTAIDTETGAELWQQGYTYPSPTTIPAGPRSLASNVVPTSGMPGGVIGVDTTNVGPFTDVVFGDLYGNLWELDPATGASRYGTGPLFSFSTDYHAIGAPPAIYSNGSQQFAVIVTGGYADVSNSVWDTTAPASPATQYLIVISLGSLTGPLNEGSGSPGVHWVKTLAAGQKGFAQVLIVGGELFVTTDSSDVNGADYGSNGATGSVSRYNMTDGATSNATVVVAGGAGSVANNGVAAGEIFVGSSSGNQKLATAQNGSTGTGVDSMRVAELSRQLWLRTQ